MTAHALRLEQAVQAVLEARMTIERAASVFGVASREVEDIVAWRRLGARAKQHAVKTTNT